MAILSTTTHKATALKSGSAALALDVIHETARERGRTLCSLESSVSEERLASFIRPQDSQGVFAPVRTVEGPDVAASDIGEEALLLIEGPNTNDDPQLALAQTIAQCKRSRA